jgi:PEP-CTERM motif
MSGRLRGETATAQENPKRIAIRRPRRQPDGEKIGGQNPGDGFMTIVRPAPAPVPEPSTWAMGLIGFAGLGWLARMRRRRTSPA